MSDTVSSASLSDTVSSGSDGGELPDRISNLTRVTGRATTASRCLWSVE